MEKVLSKTVNEEKINNKKLVSIIETIIIGILTFLVPTFMGQLIKSTIGEQTVLINTLNVEEKNKVAPSLANYALNVLENNYNKKEYDVININHFKTLINNYHNLEEQDYKDFNNFITYAKLLLIEDNDNETYLNEEQTNTLNEFKNIMNNIKNEELLSKYNNLLIECKNEQKRRENKILRLEKKDGYANAFLVIFILLITGIVIGALGYFFM